MFFESPYYASPHIEDLLKKDDVQLVEFLDDDEILQEYKSQNKNLVQFFHRPDIVEQLVTMIITEPPGNVSDAVRFKHPNVACEILTTETPDMTERLIENQPVLQKLYSFLEQDAPLNPLLTSFFSKTFGMLIVKKTEQNWFAYQCVCIQVLEFIKSRERFLETMFKHVGTPAIMDLLFQIIVNVEGPDLKNNLFNWLNEQNMVPRLINILGCDADPEKHHNVAQFVCDLIAHSRSFRQSDLVERGAHKQQLDNAGMSLLQALEAPMVTGSLLEIVLMDSNRESTIVAGIRIVLKLLEKPVINERDVSIAEMVQHAEDEHRKRLLDRLLPQVARYVRDFHHLLLNPPAKPAIQNTVAFLQPPFGQTRLQVCNMLSVLLRTGNAAIERAICDTQFFVTLIGLFKQYCWNNLLHNQVRTCLVYALTPTGSAAAPVGPDTPLSALQTHIISKCKIVSHLIDCWKHNAEHMKPTMKRGARLGYMGQLIDIFDVLTAACRSSNVYRAFVLDNLRDADELADWHRIVGAADGAPPTEPAASASPTSTIVDTQATADDHQLANSAGSEATNTTSSPSTTEDKTAATAEAQTPEEPTAASSEAENVPAVVPMPSAASDGELVQELRLQRTLLAGIDPYEKNESIFLTTEYDQDFSVDPEASERFAQACKSKDMNSANIEDILSDILNIDDCDPFGMNDDDDDDDDDDDHHQLDNDDDDDDDVDDDDNNDHDNHPLGGSKQRLQHHRHSKRRQREDDDFGVGNGGGGGSGSGGSEDDFDVCPQFRRSTSSTATSNGYSNNHHHHRNHEHAADDDSDGDSEANEAQLNDLNDLDNDCVENRTHRRPRHHRLTAQQQQRRPRIQAGDDNANNVHRNKFPITTSTSSGPPPFDISPWDSPAPIGSSSHSAAADFAATSFFGTGEVNFQAHFPDISAGSAGPFSATNPFGAAAAGAFGGGGVSAVFDPVDPFGAFGPIAGDEEPFVFDATAAFGEVLDVGAAEMNDGAAAERSLGLGADDVFETEPAKEAKEDFGVGVGGGGAEQLADAVGGQKQNGPVVVGVEVREQPAGSAQKVADKFD